jgi:hypothetical protein
MASDLLQIIENESDVQFSETETHLIGHLYS